MKHLSNPFRGKIRCPLSADEARILLHLLDGDTLACVQCFTDQERFAVRWYWETGTLFENQPDPPVVLLLARQAIRPILVAGDFVEMILTPAGRAKAKGLKK